MIWLIILFALTAGLVTFYGCEYGPSRRLKEDKARRAREEQFEREADEYVLREWDKVWEQHVEEQNREWWE